MSVDSSLFIGQACTHCGRPVESTRQLLLVCKPRERPRVLRPYHSGCVDEVQERDMSRLLGGR